MKKIQAMMAVVLVALMAFAVQSCGSDDKTPDLSGDTYKLTTSMTFQDKGQLTDAGAAALQQAFVRSETGQYITDKSAADKSKEIVGWGQVICSEVSEQEVTGEEHHWWNDIFGGGNNNGGNNGGSNGGH